MVQGEKAREKYPLTSMIHCTQISICMNRHYEDAR